MITPTTMGRLLRTSATPGAVRSVTAFLDDAAHPLFRFRIDAAAVFHHAVDGAAGYARSFGNFFQRHYIFLACTCTIFVDPIISRAAALVKIFIKKDAP